MTGAPASCIMQPRHGILFTLALALAIVLPGPGSGSARAATVIESINGNGVPGKVMIDGFRARIDGGELGGYLLIHLERKQIFAVNHEERVVLDLNSPPPSYPLAAGDKPPEPPAPPKVEMNLVGDGPTIAGYATQRYRVLANGKHCFDEFLASAPLQNEEIQRFVAVIGAASRPQQPVVLGAPYDKIPPCDAAEEIVDDRYSQLGIPMRTRNFAGNITHEIKAIRTVKAFPAGTFNFPAGYPQMSRQELFNEDVQTVPSHQNAEITMEELGEIQNMIQKQIDDMHSRRQAHPIDDYLRIRKNLEGGDSTQPQQ